MKKITLLQVLPYFPPHLGGLEMVSQEIAKYLTQYHDIQVVNITSDIGQHKRGYSSYQENGYTVICIPSFDIVPHFPCPKFWLPSFWTALKNIKAMQPDIIQTHTRFFLQTFLGGILAKLWKKKWVHVEHGSGFVVGIAWRKRAFAWLYDQTMGRIIFRCCDQIVSINKANISFISKFTSTQKIHVIYNGIQFSSEFLSKKNISDGFVRMMFIGRLSPLKGVSLLLEACYHLLEKGINNRKLAIVGDGEMKHSLDYAIKKYGLSSYVSLLGKKSHDEVITLLQQTDIVVNPSYQEGLPTCVLEGLLSQCVVVATRVGGTAEISDQKDLILVNPGDVKELEKGLDFAIHNYQKIKGLSYISVKKYFDWKINVGKYYELYTKLI